MFRRGKRLGGAPRRRLRLGGMGALFGAGGELATQAREALDEANKLFDESKFAEAGEALSELAELATQHQRPRRAAQMHYRAFDSFLKAGAASEALAQAKQALNLAGQLGKPGKAIKLAQHLIAELQTAKFSKEAEELTREVNALLSKRGVSLAATPEAAPPPAPKPHASNCAKCGARLRWMDDEEVECEYCGTITYA